MALGRLSVKSGSKGKAKSHAEYILCENKYKNKAKELLYKKNVNIPSFAKNAIEFWAMADEYERANGSTYREHIIALPREFTLEQNIQFIDEWCEQEFKNKFAYSYAIHEPNAEDGDKQPHVHLMFCERELDSIERTAKNFFSRYNAKNPQKGGAKKANTGLKPSEREQLLIEQRQRFGDTLNKHLEMNGYEPNVDMRNWQERGLSEPPNNIPFSQYQENKKLKGLQNTITTLIQELENETIANKINPHTQHDKPNYDKSNDDFDFSF